MTDEENDREEESQGGRVTIAELPLLACKWFHLSFPYVHVLQSIQECREMQH